MLMLVRMLTLIDAVDTDTDADADINADTDTDTGGELFNTATSCGEGGQGSRK